HLRRLVAFQFLPRAFCGISGAGREPTGARARVARSVRRLFRMAGGLAGERRAEEADRLLENKAGGRTRTAGTAVRPRPSRDRVVSRGPLLAAAGSPVDNRTEDTGAGGGRDVVHDSPGGIQDLVAPLHGA